MRATVVRVLDRDDGETTVTYEYNPPLGRVGTQNITVRTLAVPHGLACGDAINVKYAQTGPTIERER